MLVLPRSTEGHVGPAGARLRTAPAAWFVIPKNPWLFARSHQGGIVVPLNPALREPELAALMTDADVSLILTNEDLLERCEAALGLVSELDAAVLNVDQTSAASPGAARGEQIAWPEGPEDPVLAAAENCTDVAAENCTLGVAVRGPRSPSVSF